MDLLRTTTTAVFAIAALCAQNAGTANRSVGAYSGQTWVGLLVSADCAAPSQATSQSQMTVTDRVTTPAVDNAGTRGESNALEPSDSNGAASRKDMPQTGDVLAKRKARADANWAHAHAQAKSLGAACRVGSNSSRFALLLRDGKMLRFDDLANAAIQKRLSSGGAASIYRVQVVGKLENGAIALDNIQW